MANALFKTKPTVTVIPAVFAEPGQVENYVDIPAVIPNPPYYGVKQNPAALAIFSRYYALNDGFFDPYGHWTPVGSGWFTPFAETNLYFANGSKVNQLANITIRGMYSGPGGFFYRLHYLPVLARAFVPELDIVDRHEGWELSANSIKSVGINQSIPSPTRATFKIPDGVIGVYCGTRPAFYASHIGQWSAFRKEKTTLDIIDNGNIAVTGVSHASASVLTITFDGTNTIWAVDGVLAHRSENSVQTPLQMFAMLYSADDEVYDPALDAFTGGTGTPSFLPMQVLGGLTTAPTGRATFLPMTMHATAALNNLSFLPMSVKGGILTADGYASFKPMTISASTYATPPALVSAVLTFPTMTVSASALGYTGSASFLPMAVKGGIPTSDGSMVFASMQVFAAGYVDFTTQVAVNESMVYADAEVPVAIKPAIVSEVLGLAIVFAPITVKVANASSVMTFTGTHALLATLNGLAITVLDFGTPTPPYTDPGEVWVVNDDTNATSTYAGFAFNSFASLGERYYGVKDDGLYLLEGDDDAGVTTAANINFGQQDFGTTAAKRVVGVYVGVASTGALLLKISVNGVESVYTQQRVSEDQRVARFVPGKGMQGTLLAFELYNEDNADFTLSSVEFNAIPLTRRI